MKAVVYRLVRPEGHKSWRPRSLTDLRGAIFPDDYSEILILNADSIDHTLEQYESKLGDVIFLGEDEELMAYVAAPFGYEMVKFGREWRSPKIDTPKEKPTE